MQNEVMKEFEAIPQDDEDFNPSGWTTYHVGEIIELKDKKYKVRKITKKDLVLRPAGW